MEFQQQRSDKLEHLEQLVREGEQLFEQLQLGSRDNFPQALRELALINHALRNVIGDYQTLTKGMSIEIPDFGRLLQTDHDVVLDINFPLGSPQRREAETNGVALTLLEPFTIEAERIVGVKLKKGSLEVRDFKDIARFRSLRSLTCLLEDLSDLSHLRGHPSIDQIFFVNNLALTDLSALADMPALRQLQFFNTRVGMAGAPVLFSLDKLEVLDLGPASIDSIEGISGLKSLKVLSLWHNQVQDISELAELSGLEQLTVRSTQVRDLTPLLSCSSLNALTLEKSDFQVSGWTRWMKGLPDNMGIVEKLQKRGVTINIRD